MSEWSQQFTNRYMTAIHEMRADGFIEGVIQTIQVGQALIDEVNRVISNCPLPTSDAPLCSFIQITVKLILKLNKGVMILEEKLHSISIDGSSYHDYLANTGHAYYYFAQPAFATYIAVIIGHHSQWISGMCR